VEHRAAVALLIDREGIIRYAFVADFQTEFPEHQVIIEELGKVAGRTSESGSQNTE